MAVILYGYLRMVIATSRITFKNQHYIDDCLCNNNYPLLVAWHDNIFGLPLLWWQLKARNRGIKFLVSPHKDGIILARILELFGWSPIYGSNFANPKKALKQAISAAKKNDNMLAFTPDGPRGPRHQAAKGVSLVAHIVKRPVCLVSWRANRVKILHKTWDKTMIPLPFSNIEAVVSLIDVTAMTTDDIHAAISHTLQQQSGIVHS